MQDLKSLLNRQKSVSRFVPKIEASMVLEKYNEIILEEFGPMGKKRARALYLKGDCLCVAVLSSVMSQELKLREERIIDKLNQELGEDLITKVWYMG